MAISTPRVMPAQPTEAKSNGAVRLSRTAIA